jgi:hypothetical protein
MSKHDLQARPIYHHTRESIEAHLSIVFAALAVSHWIEHQTGWSIKKFVRTARRYRTVKVQAGRQALTAAEPLPDDLAEALTKIRGSGAPPQKVCGHSAKNPWNKLQKTQLTSNSELLTIVMSRVIGSR